MDGARGCEGDGVWEEGEMEENSGFCIRMSGKHLKVV